VTAGPHERPEDLFEEAGIKASEDASDGGFVRPSRCGHAQCLQGLDGLLGDPLPDRHERPRARDDGETDREDDWEAMLSPRPTTRVGDLFSSPTNPTRPRGRGGGHNGGRRRR